MGLTRWFLERVLRHQQEEVGGDFAIPIELARHVQQKWKEDGLIQ